MANLITEGFDWFPSGKSVSDRSTLFAANTFYKVGLYTDPANVVLGRFNFGQAISWTYSQYATSNFDGRMNGYVVTLGAIPATGFIGIAIRIDADQSDAASASIGFFDAVNNVFQIGITFDVNGVVRVYRGNPDGGTLLVTSAAGVFEEEQWFHVEAKALIADSGGTVEVRINTVPVIQLTGADTKNSAVAGFDSAFIGVKMTAAQIGTISTLMDDLFVNDTIGATMNNWAGNLRVKTQFMIANGATNNFTIGGSSPAATNWQSVLNQDLNDTKYVYSPTVGQIDLYTPDPNLNAPFVRVLQVRMGLRQDDATQRVARALIRIGGVNYENTRDHYTNQTYTFYKSRYELNPATGVSFTGAEVNGLQGGVKVQA